MTFPAVRKICNIPWWDIEGPHVSSRRIHKPISGPWPPMRVSKHKGRVMETWMDMYEGYRYGIMAFAFYHQAAIAEGISGALVDPRDPHVASQRCLCAILPSTMFPTAPSRTSLTVQYHMYGPYNLRYAHSLECRSRTQGQLFIRTSTRTRTRTRTAVHRPRFQRNIHGNN